MTLVRAIQMDELTMTLSDEGRVLLCAKTGLTTATAILQYYCR